MKLPDFFVIVKKLIKSHAAPITLAGALFVSGCYYEKVIEPPREKPYQQRSSGANGYYGNQPYRSNNYGPGYQYPPASRYYDNLYSPPPQSYYPYSDEDQYYKPPNAYGTEEIPSASDRY